MHMQMDSRIKSKHNLAPDRARLPVMLLAFILALFS